MSARDGSRWGVRLGLALAVTGLLLGSQANAQLIRSGRNADSSGKTKVAAKDSAAPEPSKNASLEQLNTPRLKQIGVPVNPSDPVAVVNGEIISRQQLADECVARKGKEILETLMFRKMVDQATRAKHLEVTAGEIEAEIDRAAGQMGIGREAWLRSLDKERGISPVQYARDIVYPMLALRKLAAPRVQVTEEDMKMAYEAHFGEKLRCRLIMCDKLRAAQEIWEALKKNPGAFEKIAQDDPRSLDTATRSLGGLMSEPITRHAYPTTVSDAAFRQLVDGDPADKDASHKPKDGDFTGPIQVTESSWIILRREGVIPKTPVDAKDPKIRQSLHDMMYEAKLRQAIAEVTQEQFKAASLENVLTGQTKMANEDQQQPQVDSDVKLMSNPQAAPTQAGKAPSASTAPASKAASQPPAGLSPEAIKRAEAIKKSFTPNP